MLEGKRDYVPSCLQNVFNAIYSGRFGNLTDMNEIIANLREGKDNYILCWDFQSYVDCQAKVDECYKKREEWISKSLKSIALSGKFSTDRTIKEYARDIWYA